MTRTPFESDKDMPEHNPFETFSGPERERLDGRDPDADDAGAGAGLGDLDELALRRLLHDAVRDVAPRAGALDRLAQAIPARRARRRQAMVGAAAGVLLIGTAVPALLHVARSASDPTATVQASRSLNPPGTPGTLGGDEQTGGPAGAGTAGATSGTGTGQTTGRPSAGASATASLPAVGDTPACSRQQLGDGTAHTDAPDDQGRVYGTFSVTNVSSTPCAVLGTGQIAVTAEGTTDPSSIQVVDHTAGDPATGLPDPSTAPAAVVLPPGQAYQVRFAWIPAAGGGTSGCATTTPPPATGGSDSAGGTGTGTDAGTDSGGSASAGGATADTFTGAAASDDGGGTGGDGATTTAPSPDDGITLAAVPPAGGPATATATISGACAGTVYQTAPLPTA
jgi:hypothetical protein